MKVFELFEQQSFDLEKFKEDCAPFLKEMKGTNSYPYHGTYNASPADYEVRTFKERTAPRDTPKDIHSDLNTHFKSKYGHEIRNWMFITSSTRDARAYGHLHVIFPIGPNYHYAWSPFVEDMTTHRLIHVSQSQRDKEVEHLPYDERIDHADEKFLTDIETINFKVDTDLKEALESGHEIHLKCERFYIFTCLAPTFENVINPFIRKNIFHKYETD